MASNTGTKPSAPAARPQPIARAQPTSTPVGASGEAAEQRVFDLLRAALPSAYRIARNLRWVLQRSPGAPTRDGESDLVIVH